MICGVWVPTDPFPFTHFSLGVYERIAQTAGQRTDHPSAYMVVLSVLTASNLNYWGFGFKSVCVWGCANLQKIANECPGSLTSLLGVFKTKRISLSLINPVPMKCGYRGLSTTLQTFSRLPCLSQTTDLEVGLGHAVSWGLKKTEGKGKQQRAGQRSSNVVLSTWPGLGKAAAGFGPLQWCFS